MGKLKDGYQPLTPDQAPESPTAAPEPPSSQPTAPAGPPAAPKAKKPPRTLASLSTPLRAMADIESIMGGLDGPGAAEVAEWFGRRYSKLVQEWSPP